MTRSKGRKFTLFLFTALPMAWLAGCLIHAGEASAKVSPPPKCHGKTATIWSSGGGARTFEGTSGKDVFVTGESDDTIYGYEGRDIVCSRGGDDTIFGGDGSDRMYMGSGDDLAEAAHGSDVVCGYGGRDGVFGGSGYDWIAAGSGIDYIDGDGFRPLKQGSYLHWRRYKKNYSYLANTGGNRIVNGHKLNDRRHPLPDRWDCRPGGRRSAAAR